MWQQHKSDPQTIVQTVLRLGSKRTTFPSMDLELVLYIGFSNVAWPLLFSCTEQPVYSVLSDLLRSHKKEKVRIVQLLLCYIVCWNSSQKWRHTSVLTHVPLFIKIKPKACDDQGKERHENGDGHRAAVGSGWNLWAFGGLHYVQTWMMHDGKRVYSSSTITWNNHSSRMCHITYCVIYLLSHQRHY